MSSNSFPNLSEQKPMSEISETQTIMGGDLIFSSSRDSQLRWMTQVTNILKKDEIKTIHPVSIFRVPTTLSAVKPEAYMPQLIGLGPYHRFRPGLYEMERYKLAAVINIRRKHSQRIEFKELVDKICLMEDEIRACYHKYLDFDGDTILHFMTIDVLFLLEFLNNYIYQDVSLPSSSRTAYLVDSEGHKLADHTILSDIMMLEYQIPIFLLRKFFSLVIQNSSSDTDENRFLSMLMGFCKIVSPLKLIKKDLSSQDVYPHHLLDLLYHSIVPPKMEDPNGGAAACPIMQSITVETTEANSTTVDGVLISGNNQQNQQIFSSLLNLSSKLNVRWVKKITKSITVITSLPWKDTLKGFEGNLNPECEPLMEEDMQNPKVEEILIPSVSDLCDVGVEFCPCGDINTIKFDKKKKKFYLPFISLNVNSEVIIRNLVAYEASIESNSLVLARYTELMNGIIDKVEDAKVLRDKKIIVNHLKSDAEVTQLFNGMSKSIRLSIVPHIDAAIKDVNTYYNNTRKVKVYRCLKKYVYNSWQFLTFLAAVLIMLLMGMQSLCTVYSCPRFFRTMES